MGSGGQAWLGSRFPFFHLMKGRTMQIPEMRWHQHCPPLIPSVGWGTPPQCSAGSKLLAFSKEYVMSEYQARYDAIVRAQRFERQAALVAALKVDRLGWFRRLIKRFRNGKAFKS